VPVALAVAQRQHQAAAHARIGTRQVDAQAQRGAGHHRFGRHRIDLQARQLQVRAERARNGHRGQQ